MLAAIERKLTALLGDGLAARASLRVEEAPGSVQPLPSGSAAVRVAVASATPRDAFERGFSATLTTGAGGVASRRVLPLAFGARVDFRRRPAGATDADLGDARARLLDDLSLSAHLLAAEEVRSGQAFAAEGAADPGYQVSAFRLDAASIDRDASDQGLTAALTYQGVAEVWPPGVTHAEGTIASIESIIAPLPIEVRVSASPVAAGGTTLLRVGAIARPTATRTPLRLGVRVVSDLPPAQRGTILDGQDGAETGLRIVAAGAASTVIRYKAPTGDLGATRAEFVAIHLATPDGQRGIFLGSAAIQLVAGGGG